MRGILFLRPGFWANGIYGNMQVVSDLIVFCVIYFYSERWTGESNSEGQQLLPGSSTHSCHLWGSRWKNVVQVRMTVSSTDGDIKLIWLTFLFLIFIISHISIQFQVTVPWFWRRDRVHVTEWNRTSVGYWYHCRCECFISHNHPIMCPSCVCDCILTAFLFCYRKTCQNSTRSHSTSNLIHHLGPKHSKSMLCL